MNSLQGLLLYIHSRYGGEDHDQLGDDAQHEGEGHDGAHGPLDLLLERLRDGGVDLPTRETRGPMVNDERASVRFWTIFWRLANPQVMSSPEIKQWLLICK